MTMEVILQTLENMDINDPNWEFPEEARLGFELHLADSLTPENKAFKDRPPENNDFKDFRPNMEIKLEFIKTFLTKLVSLKSEAENLTIKLKKDTVVLLLMLCGEHMQNKPWSSEQSLKYCEDILLLTYQLCNCSQLKELLVHDDVDDRVYLDPLFKPVLLALRPKLLKDTWKEYPAAIACFCWLLPHVKSPHLSDHLDSVLPTALILVDDYETENRLLGIKCLHHIVDNVSRTQLSWHGKSEVVYEALFRMLHFRDESLAAPLLDCLIMVVDKIETGPDSFENMFEWMRRDDLAQLVLRQMVAEQRLALRAAYAGSLPALFRLLGFSMGRWACRSGHVLENYMENAPYDTEPTTRAMIEATVVLAAVVAEHSDPRAEKHAPTWLRALLRLLTDASGAGAVPEAALPRLAPLVAPACAALGAVLRIVPITARDFTRQMREAAPDQPPALAAMLKDVIAPFAY